MGKALPLFVFHGTPRSEGRSARGSRGPSSHNGRGRQYYAPDMLRPHQPPPPWYTLTRHIGSRPAGSEST